MHDIDLQIISDGLAYLRYVDDIIVLNDDDNKHDNNLPLNIR